MITFIDFYIFYKKHILKDKDSKISRLMIELFHMKQFTSKTQKIGQLGEGICLKYLKNNNFDIVELNYTKNVGEIDIVAKKNNIIHFIEVKSGTLRNLVSHETYNPAENLNKQKLSKIQKTVLHYLDEKQVSHETRWQIDLYVVFIDLNTKKHKIEVIDNVL